MQPDQLTANERFKRGSGTRTWSAIAVAVALHFGAFLLWPAATPVDLGATPAPDSVVVMPPPPVPLPPPPENVPTPRAPVITVDAPEHVTMDPTDVWRPGPVVPPPVRESDTGSDPGPFVPFTVPPRLTNGDAVLRELRSRYPTPLRNVGLEGTVMIWVRVAEDGTVVDARVKETSGRALFDEVALDVAHLMRFRPAQNLDRPVSVWVAVPVSFRLR
ncbi:MAG TPA: energy transducer TonB [Longimicrobiales bacterium]|nr:energy transducer TonB [Longimicrobiales bacterium]